MTKDEIKDYVKLSIDKVIDDNNFKQFNPISETSIVPVNNQILIKVLFRESSITFTKSNNTRPYIGAKFIVAGTSNKNILYGKEVYLNNRVSGNTELRIKDPNNTASRDSHYQYINSLDNKARADYIKDNVNVLVVEYMIVNALDILAIVQDIDNSMDVA